MTTNFYGNPGMNYGMYGTGAPVAKPKMCNPLTDEERASLKNVAGDKFNLSLDVKDLAIAFCTHKDPNTGLYTVINNGDGTLTCTQCHQTFKPDECTPEAVKAAAEVMRNVLQTIKYIGLDLSDEVIRGYFGFLPYIEKIPQLYEIALSGFNRYNPDALHGNVQQPNMAQNVFGAFNTMMNPSMPLYNGYMQQPMGNVPYYNNPQQQAMFNQPQMQQMPGNPFYAQQQAMAPQPQAVMPAQPVAPTAPVMAPVAPAPMVPQPEQVVVKEQLQL